MEIDIPAARFDDLSGEHAEVIIEMAPDALKKTPGIALQTEFNEEKVYDDPLEWWRSIPLRA